MSGATYGYRYISKWEGGGAARYDVVLEEARVVRQIFTWVGQERCPLGEVRRRLRRQGTPSPKGKDCWDPTTIWGMLQNPAYLGTAKYGKTRIGPMRPRLRTQRNQEEQPRRAYSVYDSEDGGVPIEVPALVDEALFAAAAEQLQENRCRARQGHRGTQHLLQGLLVCKRCGYALYGKRVSPAAAKGKDRQYAYYRCTGMDAYRFGGQRICWNKQVRTDLLEAAVWQDVCALLNDPEKVAQEYQRRRTGKKGGAAAKNKDARAKLTQKVKRGIARLIDAYAEGLLEKKEFEPRVRAAKERLAKLEAEAQAEAEEEAQEQELRLVIGHLQEFAEHVRSGLVKADWSTRREIIRALVKRVEVDQEEVRVVYRVSLAPFVEGPNGGILQDCGRRDFTALSECFPALRFRLVGPALAKTPRTGRRDRRPVRGRFRHGVPTPFRRRTLPPGASGALRQVRPGIAPRENPLDRVRSLCGWKSGQAWAGQTRNVHFPRLHASMREDAAGGVYDQRKSAAKRMRAKLQEIKTRLQRSMHAPVAQVGPWLRSVIQGWFNYHAVPGNGPCLDQFRTQVARMWLHVLRRRSQKGRSWTWERMSRLIRRWLPSARILHPYPNKRLVVPRRR